MIANAAIFPTSTFIETSVEKFKKVMDTNIPGVFLCFKHAAIQMIKQGRGGRLIAARSGARKRGVPHLADYSASKFAVCGLVQSASLELRTYGITVNAYAPGYIAHPSLLLTFKEDEPKFLSSQNPAGKPENIASMVSYLVKPEAYFVNCTGWNPIYTRPTL
ncbi:hypothetical protein ACEPAF_8922 [Sanghuangporus sanghuang]